MNVLSLFDGMSCARIALERAGIPVTNYFASEVDKSAIKISRDNWPLIRQLGDVTKIKYKTGGYQNSFVSQSDPSGLYFKGKIDLLIGGSPCQGFSVAGKQLNFEDPRSKLFFEFLRLKNECNPEFFLLENVKMPKSQQDIITGFLGVKPILINSNLVSAQNRERLYWTNIPFTEIEDKNIFLKDICDGFESGTLTQNKDEINTEIKRFTKRHIGITFHPNGNIRPYKTGKAGIGECTLICHTNNKSNTLIKSHAVKIYKGNPFKIRKVTQLEAERLQTVPDGYTKSVSYNQAISALGNGWTVDLIAHIFLGYNPNKK